MKMHQPKSLQLTVSVVHITCSKTNLEGKYIAAYDYKFGPDQVSQEAMDNTSPYIYLSTAY